MLDSQPRPNHALQRTAPRVTVAAIPAWTRPVRSWLCSTSAACFCAPPSQLPRHAPPSLSLLSFGDFAHLFRAMNDFLFPSLRCRVPSVDCRAQSVDCRAPSIDCRAPSVDCRVPSIDCRVPSIDCRVPSVDCRVPSVDCRASTESRRASRNSFREPVLNPTSPNHALQRTAPRVTLAAILRSTRLLRLTRSLPRASSLSLTPQPARRAPQSLSLGSLGVATVFL